MMISVIFVQSLQKWLISWQEETSQSLAIIQIKGKKLINEKIAYGGRAALLPLIQSIISSKKKRSRNINFESNCEQECKTVKSVFIRSASLLSNSKKIVLK